MRVLLGLVMLHVFSGTAFSQEPPTELAPVDVVSTTPLAGFGTEVSKVPSNVQSIKAEQAEEQRTLEVTNLLQKNMSSVTIIEGAGNPFQSDILFRLHCFTASWSASRNFRFCGWSPRE